MKPYCGMQKEYLVIWSPSQSINPNAIDFSYEDSKLFEDSWIRFSIVQEIINHPGISHV